MNIFQSIGNAFRRGVSAPTNSDTATVTNLTLDSEALRQTLAEMNSVDGTRVTERTVLGLPAAWRAVVILSHLMAGFPHQVIRRPEGGEPEVVKGHPINYALMRRANPRMSGFEFRRLMQAHLSLRGDAFARIIRPLGRGGRWELLPFDLDTVKPRKTSDNLRLEYVINARGRNRRETVLPQSEVFHLRGISLDGVNGLSPVAIAARNFAIALDGQKGARKLLRQGSFAGYGLKHPGKLSERAYKNLQTSFAEKFQGVENAGIPPVFEEGLEPTPLGFNATDAQFLDGRKFSLVEIGMIFGIPPHMLGNTEKSTSWGTGIAQQNQGFVDYSLMEHIRIWESAVDFQLLEDDDLYSKNNLSALLRGDPLTRAQFYQIMRLIGAYNANEVRAFEDEPPREDEGGEEYLTPSGAMLSPFPPQQGQGNQGGSNDDQNA